MRHHILTVVLTFSLFGCTSTTQTSSGQEYLSKYQDLPISSSSKITDAKGNAIEIKSIDQRVREAAAVEPILNFPARIGLARIDNGSLSNIPQQELESWVGIRDKLGEGFGDFVPVNPMITKMVSGSSSAYGRNTDSVIDSIRLGAARQHLDAVLIYEVISKESEHDNLLKIANLSIIGGYILPSERKDVEGLGNAIFIDVIQGYPYGTFNTVVDKKSRLSSSWGWGSDRADTNEMSDKIKAQAASQLADESYGMFMKLRAELSEKKEANLKR